MTPIPSAAGADQQPAWTTGLRISEVEQSSPVASRLPSHVPYAAMLHALSRSIQAGWKWLERKRTLQLSSRRLRLTETVSLGEKRSVSIIQVDGAQFLIGCSTGSVQLLARLDGADDSIKSPSESERAS